MKKEGRKKESQAEYDARKEKETAETDAVKKLSHQLPKIKNKIIGTVKWFNCELGY